jgi:hypothetical protein
MMFKTAPDPLPVKVVEVPAETLIPISVLSLDLEAPSVGGWDAYLNSRGIEVIVDDVGRKAVSRADARQLLDEKRAAEAHAREVMERREQLLVQQDQLRRASLPTGIPAGMVPDGLRSAEAMMLAGESSAPRAKNVREQLLERELGSGESMVFNSFGPDEEA